MTRFALTADRVITAAGEVGDTVVINDDRVAAVTTRDRLGDIDVIEHRGATLTPAFVDSHLHPLGYAALVSGTSLKDAADFAELAERLADAASRLRPGRALVAQRLDDNTLGRLPTRHDLDAAVGDRPVIAYRYCGHVAVANTAALHLAGVGPTTPDPDGGTIDRHPDGYPTGVLRETAVELVGTRLEALVDPPDEAAVLSALEGLVAVGIQRIGAMVAAGKGLWCGVGDELETLCRLSCDLPLVADVMVITDRPQTLEAAARRLEKADGQARFWGWKGFADGSLGGRTAAMWQPYADHAGTGTLRLHPEQAATLARTAIDLGGVSAIHAIGDRAIDATLDLYQRLIDEGYPAERMRVEHVSVASDAAIARLADLGVVASVQPSFLSSEPDWVPARLGVDRPAYRFATMREAGVELIGGSDCPVERPDPLVGIEVAATRTGWMDGEELDLAAAVEMYTAAPARHLGLGEPLAVGSPADLVVSHGTEVAAVYRRGRRLDLRPVPWPG